MLQKNAASQLKKAPFVPTVPVVHRENVFGGVITEVFMPKRGRLEVATIAKKEIICWRLLCPVIRGHIGLYVLSGSLQKPLGERMVGHLSLWNETFADRRRFPALHFKPADEKPTHRLVVIAHDEVPAQYGRERVYGVNPLVGYIIYKRIPPK